MDLIEDHGVVHGGVGGQDVGDQVGPPGLGSAVAGFTEVNLVTVPPHPSLHPVSGIGVVRGGDPVSTGWEIVLSPQGRSLFDAVTDTVVLLKPYGPQNLHRGNLAQPCRCDGREDRFH
ncbi:hypothetical protein LZG04_15550 [Saccharothrix sp. S26]|uniref:hypothetical protein n=1 Tax=Saccharothrix sp. S26 TaxID=2907215 RepID=UPI001F2C24CC|nr:hypothetical protein [Saccharothrix sp. S26]MCE6996206.1 hypothetical protein [Saccharothrix sp. S26]